MRLWYLMLILLGDFHQTCSELFRCIPALNSHLRHKSYPAGYTPPPLQTYHTVWSLDDPLHAKLNTSCSLLCLHYISTNLHSPLPSVPQSFLIINYHHHNVLPIIRLPSPWLLFLRSRFLHPHIRPLNRPRMPLHRVSPRIRLCIRAQRSIRA